MKIDMDMDSFKNLCISAEQVSKAFTDFINTFAETEHNRDLYRVLANPVDTGKLRDSIKADDKLPYNRTGSIAGMPVIESSFVEEGTVFLVPEHRNFGYGKLPAIDMETHKRIEEHFRHYFAHGVGVPSLYFNEQPRDPSWYRMDGESLVEWGNRLEKIGLLDNPKYRGEYQKAVLNAVFVIPVQMLIDKIRGVLHE